MVSVVPYIITFNENTLILSTFFVFWSMTLFLVFLGCHLSAPCFDLQLLEWLSAHLYSTHISYRVCIPMWCFMWVVVWMLRKLSVPVSLFCGRSQLISSVTFAILLYVSVTEIVSSISSGSNIVSSMSFLPLQSTSSLPPWRHDRQKSNTRLSTDGPLS